MRFYFKNSVCDGLISVFSIVKVVKLKGFEARGKEHINASEPSWSMTYYINFV